MIETDFPMRDLHYPWRYAYPRKHLDGGWHLAMLSVMCDLIFPSEIVYFNGKRPHHSTSMDNILDAYVGRSGRGSAFEKWNIMILASETVCQCGLYSIWKWWWKLFSPYANCAWILRGWRFPTWIQFHSHPPAKVEEEKILGPKSATAPTVH
jgi:hypothetical protein